MKSFFILECLVNLNINNDNYSKIAFNDVENNKFGASNYIRLKKFQLQSISGGK